MTFSIKTTAELLTNFADNTTGTITARYIRDFLKSVYGVYGGLAIASSSIVSISNATPTLVTAWDTALTSNGLTVSTSSDNITITTDGVYRISLNISGTLASAVTATLQLTKNGTLVTGLQTKQRFDGTNIANMSIEGLVSLVATDTLEAKMLVSGGASVNLTFETGQFIAQRLA